jgi:uracil-DNA glycosylase family 4
LRPQFAQPTVDVEAVRTQTPPRPVVAKPQTIKAAAAESSFWKTVAIPSETLPTSGETFEHIWADVGDCTRCGLCQGRTNIVHTEGNRKARLMFIGEAPGADEDAQARPFVGRAGQLLTKIIEAIGFKREEVLIGNINRCRPPGNRAPLPDEVSMCKPFLLREIAAAKPEVIVVMGNTAMKNLLDTREGITRARGVFQEYKGVKVMPTFHPAYLLRDPSKKRETWEDLKKVRAYLDSTSRSDG